MMINVYGPDFNSSDFRRCIVALPYEFDIRLVIRSVFMLCNFVVGLPTNTWVIWIICRGNRELLALEIYFLSLAVCEILYCLGLPAQLYCFYIFEPVSEGISVLLSLQWYLAWIGRPLFQSCICVDRYIAVVHPLIFLRLKSLKYRVAECALAWSSFFLIISLAPVVQFISLIWFTFTFCLLLYCTLSVLRSLKRPGPGEREGEERKGGNQMKRKAFKIILVHLLCFLINYLPALIYRILTQQIQIPLIVLDLISSLGVVCGLIQPVLYLNRVGKLPCIKAALT